MQALLPAGQPAHHYVVVHKVAVGHITWEAVGDQQVAVPVVVHIGGQGAPAPVGGRHAGLHTYVTEYQRAIVDPPAELQGVARELRQVAEALVV